MNLSEEQIEFYHAEGYLVISSFFAVEAVNSLAAEVDQLLRQRAESLTKSNMRIRFKNHCDSGEPLLEVLDPLSDISPIAKAIAADPRLAELLVGIYGEPACLFKDKFIYKPAGAEGATLHQDWISWPGFPESFLTVLVAIDPFTEETGATKVYPRMHQRGYLSPKNGQHHLLKHEAMRSKPITLALSPGDIAIFGGFIPHYSDANRGCHARRGYFISYNAQSDGGEQWSRHYQEFHQWIRSRLPEERKHEMVFV